MAALLELRGLVREYPAGEGTVAVLRDVDLTIEAGEMVAIIGPSGSGKSTLMNILGCLDRPTRGSYRVAGQETGAMGPDELARLRREHFGFIFQRYHLLPHLDAEDKPRALYHGLSAVARDCDDMPPRFNVQPLPARSTDVVTLKRWFRRFVEVRDAEGAERCIVSAVRAGADHRQIADMLFAAVTDHRGRPHRLAGRAGPRPR